MTPSVPDSAEKIADACARLCSQLAGHGACEKCITDALTAYGATEYAKGALEQQARCVAHGQTQYERGVNEAIKAGGIVAKSVYDKGFREAIEKAAEVAEDYVEEQMGSEVELWELGLCRKIAKKIRALRPPSEGAK